MVVSDEGVTADTVHPLLIYAELMTDPDPRAEGWTRDKKMEHRFYSPDGVTADILPAGNSLLAQGHIQWPSGHRMSLAGFGLAFEQSTSEQVKFESHPTRSRSSQASHFRFGELSGVYSASASGKYFA